VNRYEFNTDISLTVHIDGPILAENEEEALDKLDALLRDLTVTFGSSWPGSTVSATDEGGDGEYVVCEVVQ